VVGLYLRKGLVVVLFSSLLYLGKKERETEWTCPSSNEGVSIAEQEGGPFVCLAGRERCSFKCPLWWR